MSDKKIEIIKLSEVDTSELYFTMDDYFSLSMTMSIAKILF